MKKEKTLRPYSNKLTLVMRACVITTVSALCPKCGSDVASRETGSLLLDVNSSMGYHCVHCGQDVSLPAWVKNRS